MTFQSGKNDNYQGERFITFSEAAEILGSGNHTRIRNLVLSGSLVCYKIPLVDKLRVKKSAVLALIRFDGNTENLTKPQSI
tara:strand:- start:737 stop:979 length:243 start_codon:yes stop_codon:yes gene_type:complete